MVANYAMSALVSSAPETAAEVLEQLVASPDDEARANAANWLVRLPGQEGRVRELAEDSSPDVRAAAFGAIAMNYRPEDLALVLGGTRDRDPSVRSAALRSLVNAYDEPAARDALLTAISDDDENVASVGIQSASAIGDDAIPLLIERMTDQERPELRAFAAMILRQMGAELTPEQERIADELARNGD
jgi:HEAT repeat protein